MGTSERYAESIDHGMDRRVTDVVMRSGSPLSLTDEGLQLDVYPLTRTPLPRVVRAWIRYPSAAVQIDARMVAWTLRAAALEWAGPDGQKHRSWVWASAIDDREGAND